MPPTKPRRRPTAADVARRSEVSPTTVSYVLNQTPGQVIPEATRQRVRAAAAELGYIPSASAQALARGSSRIVILDMHDIPRGFAADAFVDDLSAHLSGHGYIPIPLRSVRKDDDDASLLELAAAVAPRAIVCMGYLKKASREKLKSFGVPTIVSLADSPQAIQKQAAEAARAQVRYLAEVGHRVVAYCSPSDPQLATLAKVRSHAITDECAIVGIKRGPDIASAQDLDHLSGSLDELLDKSPEVTAVAAYNDEVAISLIAAAHHSGIQMPRRLAVIGIDDIPFAATSVPSLTTVRAKQLDLRAEELERFIRSIMNDGELPLPLDHGSDTFEIAKRESA